MEIPTIDIDKALKLYDQGALFIDGRSETEFAEGTIPGAVNVPILNNDERREIGICYKKEGSKVARRRGVDVVSPKIPSLISSVESAMTDQKQTIVLFCWRGGMRSRAFTTFLNLAGYKTYQLIGGYKAFRRHIIDYFEQPQWGRLLVLRGMTGVGKTVLLHRLKKDNYRVLDIEGLANHRGSTFGGFGLPPQPTQKQFDALLWRELRKSKPDDIIISEGESKRVGSVRLPDNLYNALQIEKSLWIEAGLDFRAKVILDDYPVGPHLKEAFSGRIEGLKNRLGGSKVKELQGLIDNQNWPKLVEMLMIDYYDPLYMHTKPERRIDIQIDAAGGYEKLLAAISKLTTS